MAIKIESIFCPATIKDKIESKHSVTAREARQVLLNKPRIRFAEKGFVENEDIYASLSRTYVGRYLAVFFVHKPATVTAIIISARDMTPKERKRYGKK